MALCVRFPGVDGQQDTSAAMPPTDAGLTAYTPNSLVQQVIHFGPVSSTIVPVYFTPSLVSLSSSWWEARWACQRPPARAGGIAPRTSVQKVLAAVVALERRVDKEGARESRWPNVHVD